MLDPLLTQRLRGLEDEYEICSHLVPCTEDADCLLAEWDEWSDCSCSCYGVKERHRRIEQFAKAGWGCGCLFKGMGADDIQ